MTLQENVWLIRFVLLNDNSSVGWSTAKDSAPPDLHPGRGQPAWSPPTEVRLEEFPYGTESGSPFPVF